MRATTAKAAGLRDYRCLLILTLMVIAFLLVLAALCRNEPSPTADDAEARFHLLVEGNGVNRKTPLQAVKSKTEARSVSHGTSQWFSPFRC
jgi:hypothetical protein